MPLSVLDVGGLPEDQGMICLKELRELVEDVKF